MLVRIGIAASLLGVCRKTLRRWEQLGRIRPVRTAGNHRRYERQALLRFILTGVYEPQQPVSSHVAIYGRVSSSRQKRDLDRQLQYLRQHPQVQNASRIYEFKDIASGLNDTRKGLLRLLRGAARGEFSTVVVTYADRLSRFGLRLIREVFRSYDVSLVILGEKAVVEPQQQIVSDIVSLMHSFTGKLYRMRRGTTTVVETPSQTC